MEFNELVEHLQHWCPYDEAQELADIDLPPPITEDEAGNISAMEEDAPKERWELSLRGVVAGNSNDNPIKVDLDDSNGEP